MQEIYQYQEYMAHRVFWVLGIGYRDLYGKGFLKAHKSIVTQQLYPLLALSGMGVSKLAWWLPHVSS